jgi:hypothetical protein
MTKANTLILICLILFCVPTFARAADDAQCALVKIEISQELTLERQAFDAHMRITNGLSNVALENVGVTVAFTDEAGNPVLATSNPDDPNALFYIRVDSMANIDDVTGNGTVSPSSIADIHWLIIPAPGASNGLASGTLYYVGATLTYYLSGEENVTEVMPDYIFVKSMPELVLDYFLPKDVYGDDAFTPEIEPAVPFSLGVRVKNNGAGVVQKLKIDSAQPKIVENEQGLLIGFMITGSEVNGGPGTESLLVDFGDIPSGESGLARWIMTCTLSGKFIAFEADFTHADELGGELTSLIEAVNTHTLLQDVLVDLPGSDSIRDFLALDGNMYRVYESNSTETVVTDQSVDAAYIQEEVSGTQTRHTLTLPVTAGFVYAKLTDPFAGQRIIIDATRSDGKIISKNNIWLSKTRNEDQSWAYFINIFDANTTGSYTVWLDDAVNRPQPPVLQFIPDRERNETQQLLFIVEASDPNGTTPALTASSLPAGATFVDQGDGTAIFDWTPAIGQKGVYEVLFTASDGELTTSQRATLTIYAVNDTDRDGMDDDWELMHFGTLDRDGTGDFDGDGISDLDEFLNGTDPTTSETAPTQPDAISPLEQENVTDLTPDLVVANSDDAEGDLLSYEFEIYTDLQMTDLVASDSDVPQDNPTAALLVHRWVADNGDLIPGDPGTTAWTLPINLADNTRYFWRTRSTDGKGISFWEYSSFFVNTQNDPPTAFVISSPSNGKAVDTLTPLLTVNNSTDIDQNILTYTFEVYADNGLTQLITSSLDIDEGINGTTSWVVNIPLNDQTWYYWRAVAIDENNAQTATETSSFYIDTANHAPETPVIAAPTPAGEIDGPNVALVIDNATDADGDPLTYLFEIDTCVTFDSTDKQVSQAIAPGIDTTQWVVSGLHENTLYYWRIKATDGSADSHWASSTFFVNSINDAASTPTLKNPGQNAWVNTVTPTLSVLPCSDPDNDTLTYEFEVYANASFTRFVAQGESSTTQWIVPVGLMNSHHYYWRARAVDEHGYPSPWMTTAVFYTNSDIVNTPPQITIVAPAVETITHANSILIQWDDTDIDTNAEISLYYDTDNQDEDGTLIAGGIWEDPDGDADTYTWDISGLEGTYYVYAQITDNKTPMAAYSAAAITIDRTLPSVSAQPGTGTFTTPQTVVLTADETANIYYTLDGSDPTATSAVYDAPIIIDQTTTLKFIAVDLAGNISPIVTATYTFEASSDLRVNVTGTLTGPLSGIKVYAFKASGSYYGKSATTNTSGDAVFSAEDFTDGDYKFRIDYCGYQFWTDLMTLPGTALVSKVLEETAAAVTVRMAGGAAAGVRVYLFSESGSYLGIYSTTDANGQVAFNLPVGVNYKFRADVLGSQYFSEVIPIQSGGSQAVNLDTGGGHFTITLQEDPQTPMANIKMYLFNASDSYLGKYQVSDASGQVTFDVPEGSYKTRADYLGYPFWSDVTFVETDTITDLTLPHQDINITAVGVYQDIGEPLANIKIYLFSSSGDYLNQNQTTDDNGQVVFHLPEKPFKVRVDYLGTQFWSDDFTWQDTVVAIPHGDAEITVFGAGMPREGVKVYLFSAGSYLGWNQTTDSNGRVMFTLPNQCFKFRADYQGNQYWSDETIITADVLNPVNIAVGGGTFRLAVKKDSNEPVTGVKCYVFDENESYIGLSGVTDVNGDVFFDLADGVYKIRVDYMGNQFWTDLITVPDTLSTQMTLAHKTADVTVTTTNGPAAGVRVYLFAEAGAYLGKYQDTDANGRVQFDLPVGRTFKFRADILGNQYWSDLVTITSGDTNFVSLDTGGGLWTVRVEQAPDVPMTGIKVYLFSESGSYLGISHVTDATGTVSFEVPEGTYKVRADYLGYQFFSADTLIVADFDSVLSIPHQSVQVAVEGVFQGVSTPMAGVPVYLFSPTGTYLGVSTTTDASGHVTFDLPLKDFKVRADYLGMQFWSEVFNGQDSTVAISMADAQVTVTGAGLPQAGIKVYVFSETGSYLGMNSTTDANGQVVFRLPSGIYRFRADYQTSQYWSTATLNADMVNPVIISVGGGSFGLTLMKNATDPLVNTKVYVFNQSGAYTGLSGTTDENGLAGFNLADGTYQFRVDYLGYQFWSNLITVPDSLAETVTIDHQDTYFTLQSVYTAAESISDIKVYLFTASGSYVGQHAVTDANGRAIFGLPSQPYKIRADYLGEQYWSDVFQFQDITLSLNHGVARINVLQDSVEVAGARVYLFEPDGTYLGTYETTDAIGQVSFKLPVEDADHVNRQFKFRADVDGTQYWSDAVNITAGEETEVDINID